VARYASVNYTPPFPYADTDPDIFDSRDVQQLARAVEDHYHGPNYGRPVSHADLTGGAIGDPHPQYLTQAEGDALYIDQAELDAAVAAASLWNDSGAALTPKTAGRGVTTTGLTTTGTLVMSAAPTLAANPLHLAAVSAAGGTVSYFPWTALVAAMDALFLTPVEGDARYIDQAELDAAITGAALWNDTGTVLSPVTAGRGITTTGRMTSRTATITNPPALAAAPLNFLAVSAAGGEASYYPYASLVTAMDALFLTQAEGDALYAPITLQPLPPGGAAGDVLTKNTATDFDAGWATPFNQTAADLLYVEVAGDTMTGPLVVQALTTSQTLVLTAAPTLAAAPSHLMAVSATGGSVSYFAWTDLTAALDAMFLTQAEGDALYTAIAHETALDPHAQYITQAEGDALWIDQTELDAALAAAALWADSGTALSPVTAGHGITTTGLTTTGTAVITAAPTLAAAPLHFIAVAAAGGSLSHYAYADLVTAMDALFLTQAEGDALYMSINAQTLPPGGNAGDALVKNTATDFDVVWGEVLTTAEGNALYATIASGLPPGGAVGDMLVKQTATDYDAIWQAPPAGAVEYWGVVAGELVPVAGEPVAAAQLRASASATLAAAPLHFVAVDAANGVYQQYPYASLVTAMDALFLTPAEANLLYAPITQGIPPGGAVGEVLQKQTATDFDAIWGPVVGLPPGGVLNDVLIKQSATDGDAIWTAQPWLPLTGSVDVPTSMKGPIWFTPDQTHDIGQSTTANRPRDGFFGRDLSVGQNAAVGNDLDVIGLVQTGTLQMTAAPAGTVKPLFILGLDALGGIVQTYDASLLDADGVTWGELEGAGQTWGDLEGTLPLAEAQALAARVAVLEARLAAIGA